MNWSAINGNSTAKKQYYWPYYKECYYIAFGMQWCNVILIISLNTAVIVTILRHHKNSRLYFLLMNMAIADLITGVIDALVNAIERTMGLPYFEYWWFAWFAGETFCKFQRWASNVSLCASNFILAATSVDRALVVAKPMLNFKRGYILQKALIIACWCLSAVVNIPLFIYTHRFYKHLETEVPTCDLIQKIIIFYWEETVHLFITVYVWFPLTVIIASYTVLIYAIYKRASSPPNSIIRGINNLKIPMVFNRGLPSSKARSIKLTFGIVLSFLFSWTPYCLMMYLGLWGIYEGPVRMIFVTSFYWNCVSNPIVFFVFHKRGSILSSNNSSLATNKHQLPLQNRKTLEVNIGDAAEAASLT